MSATMIQLWAWEYKGMTQLGYEVGKITGQPRRFERFDNPTKYERLNENQVTKLRKVKVVDEDALVIGKVGDLYERQQFTSYGTLISTYKVMTLLSTPPITEPKNFEAIVEADLEGNFSISGTKAMPDVKGRKLYKRNSDGSWQLVNTNLTTWWKWLINPTIISEGVEG